MTWFETAFGAHYSWLYAHRDAAEALACVDTLAGHVPLAAGPVLDLGCGEGRHLPTLAARCPAGVTGLDLSADLLARAGKRATTTRGLVRADMRLLPFASNSFGAVLSLFTAFGYFGGLDAHAGLLAEISRVLAGRGVWCLDYLNCRRVVETTAAAPVSTARDVGPCKVRETKTLAGDRANVRKRVEITSLPGRETEALALGVPARGLDYTESVALFEPEALDALAVAAGLTRCDAVGGYDGRVFEADTAERWLLFYRRNEA